jgi:hypothetical protein
MYDRESAAWERRRDEPEHRELVERIADELANVVAPPGRAYIRRSRQGALAGPWGRSGQGRGAARVRSPFSYEERKRRA